VTRGWGRPGAEDPESGRNPADRRWPHRRSCPSIPPAGWSNTEGLTDTGIKFNMNGNQDSYPIEGSEIARYDTAQQAWIQQGDIVEMSGKSSNCAWDQASSSCRTP
jgi:hypothetical protein